MLTLLILLCALIVILVVLQLYLRYCYDGRLMSKVPGPPGLPLLGNALAISKSGVDLFKFVRASHKTYGPLWKLGTYNTTMCSIQITRPEDLEKVLSSTQHNHKDIPYKFLRGWLGQGLLVSNDNKWQHRRKLLTPTFHFNILSKFIKTFCLHSQDLVDALEKEVGKDKTDLGPLITMVTFRIICETSMGTEIREETTALKQYSRAVHKIGEVILQRLSMPWFYSNGTYMISSLWRREKYILPDLHKFTKDLIQIRRDFMENNEDDVEFSDDITKFTKDGYELSHDDISYGKTSKPAMLDLLLEEQKKGKIDDAGIREEVDTFLFEGHDTTQSAITFMIMRIANESAIQNKIYQELESIFEDSPRQPTLQDLNKMKYLEYCIKESLRLYPSVPFIARKLTKDVELAGRLIPKNIICNIHIFDTHRNPEIYPEPEKFIPERFFPENTIGRHPYAYIPFSAGPRNCIGQKFAIMEMKTIMAGILRRYRVEPVTKNDELEFMSDLVLRTSHPLYVRFCYRK